MVIEDALFILLRRIPPEKVIESWIKSNDSQSPHYREPLCLLPDEKEFYTALQNQYPHYSINEAEYAYKYAKEIAKNINGKNTGVFGLIAESVKNLLTTDSRNECLCKYKCLLMFRELTHPIDPLIFQSAFLAQNDLDSAYERHVFSWPLNMHTDNERLYHILNKGMAENHFHVGGSSNTFQFSWLCLMNNYTASRKKEFKREGLDEYPMDTLYSTACKTDSYYTLTFKAVCIRLFLYLRLQGEWVIPDVPNDEGFDVVNENNKWLTKMLTANDDECDLYVSEINNIIFSQKSLCKNDTMSHVVDYALKDEPKPPEDDSDKLFYNGLAVRNYERRLFYPLAGEQRLLYKLFFSIYQEDDKIIPYLDIVYSYLLIYCKIRSELMQVNNRVGFGNFLKYQDRKDIFTENYPMYDNLRKSIAQQVVLLNPQIVSFEGRLCPSNTPEKLIQKIKNLRELALTVPCGDEFLKKNLEEATNKKLHYVLHFPKKSQEYKKEDIEMIVPRDYILRKQIEAQATAIITAKNISPDIMSLVSGIDACSNEIDCRPEVFAPEFRHIREQRYNFDGFVANFPRHNLRLTYHAGEDFLDPIDGVRAIDEAIAYLEMRGGDRLGHALALGIDCEEWYQLKCYTVLLKKQSLLDNLAWLYGKMHHFNIHNTAAEDQIFKWFKKLYTEIYTNSLSEPSKSIIYTASIMDYYASLNLRGNDPFIYFHNPDGTKTERKKFENSFEEVATEPWKIRKNAGKSYDPISNALYHYYHFNMEMKLKSDECIEYYVPKCIIDVICMIQEKMQYDVSFRNISVECNPSSNYLIGTFKDYLKHPIFKFNNSYLYSVNDKRSLIPNPKISASINTDDLGIFDTSLENEFALLACALEKHNEYCSESKIILPDNIYAWLDYIREQGLYQSFIQIQP